MAKGVVFRLKYHIIIATIFFTSQDGEAPEMSVRFARECLEVYSWVQKLQYSALCQAIGSGIYQHLQVVTLLCLGIFLFSIKLYSNVISKHGLLVYLNLSNNLLIL